MLAHSAWVRRFDRDRDILGRTVYVAGTPVTVVGVARPEFTGPSRYNHPTLWIPIEQAVRVRLPGRPARKLEPAADRARAAPRRPLSDAVRR